MAKPIDLLSFLGELKILCDKHAVWFVVLEGMAGAEGRGLVLRPAPKKEWKFYAEPARHPETDRWEYTIDTEEVVGG